MPRPPKDFQDGYQLHEILVASLASKDDDAEPSATLTQVSIALPADEGIRQLVLARNQAARHTVMRINDESEASSAGPAIGGLLTSPKSAASPPARSALKLDPEAERALLLSDYEATMEVANGIGGDAQVQIMDWAEPLKLIDSRDTRTPDKAMRERDDAIYKQLRELGAFRQVAGESEIMQALERVTALRPQQPQFAQVIDFIVDRMRLALDLGQPLLVPPILLVGSPGGGKTHFSFELAKALGRSVHRHSFDAGYTGCSLIGSDRHWSNTSTGLVFDAVCLSPRADPLILLDEIDKGVNSSERSKTLDPLHSLLEPLSARSVKDISSGITFDASHICWVATANDLERIPQPIRSRFLVFVVQPPTPAQAIDLARAVVDSFHARNPALDPPERRVPVCIAHLTPRSQLQVLEQAMARAVANGRRQILVRDLPASCQPEDECAGKSQALLH